MKQPRGFIALISAVIISTILLGLAVAAGSSTITVRLDALNSEYKHISLGLAEACVHAALLNIGQDYTYKVPLAGTIVQVGTAYGTTTSCTIVSPTTTPTEIGGKRTFTISTRAQFYGAFSNVSVSAVAQSPTSTPVVPPPTCALTVTPTSVPQGQNITLGWNTAGAATSLSVDQGIGALALPLGTALYAPVATPGVVTYTGTATNAGGSNTCTAILTITAPPPSPSCADTAMMFDRTGSMDSTDLTNEYVAGKSLLDLYKNATPPGLVAIGRFADLQYAATDGYDGSAGISSIGGSLSDAFANYANLLNALTRATTACGGQCYGTDVSAAITAGKDELHPSTKQKVLMLVSDADPSKPTSFDTSGTTGPNPPSANVQNAANDSWTNPMNVYADGGGDMSTTTAWGARHRLYNFNFAAIPSGATIDGIELKADAWTTASALSQNTPNLTPQTLGPSSSWGPNTGSDVAAVTTNDTTAYITPGAQQESFGFANAGIPAGATNISVTVHAVALGTGSTLKFIEENGTNQIFEPATHTLTASYADYSYAFPTMPNGAAWTLAEVNAWTAHFGVVNASGNTARVTQMYVSVGYTVAPASVSPSPSAIGNYDQWSSNGSSNKVTDVATSDADSNYISETNQNDVETFSFTGSGVPAGASITDVTVSVVARDSSGSPTIKIRAEKGTGGGSQSDGNTINLTGSYQTYTRAMTTNPFTGAAWTLAEVNAWTTKFGVIKTSSSGTARVTQIDVVVNYTLPSVATGNLTPQTLGPSSSWGPNTGSDVAAVTTNDTTAYITPGAQQESFGFANAGIPAGATNISVTVHAVALGTGSTLKFIEENGTNQIFEPATHTLTASYADYSYAFPTMPNGAAWTLAEVNAWTAHFGVVNASGNTARVTQMYVSVGYTIPPAYACQLGVDLSWNGGTNWTTEKQFAAPLTNTETTYQYGSSTDPWLGHTWAYSDFVNGSTKFMARVHAIDPGANCSPNAVDHVDYLTAKVYYHATTAITPTAAATAAAVAAKADGDTVIGIYYNHSGQVAADQNFLQTLTSPSALPVLTVASASRVGTMITATTTAQNFLNKNQRIQISGFSDASFNGTFVVTAIVNATTFRYTSGTSGTKTLTNGTETPTNLFIPPFPTTQADMQGIFSSVGSQVCPAAAPACSNTIDDDGDGLTDIDDPGCHTDGNASNVSSYDSSDNNEWQSLGTPTPPPPPPPPPSIIIGSWQENP